MMKNLLFLLFSFFLLNSIYGQEVYMSTSFDDGMPDGWSVDGEWTFGSASEVSSQFFNVPDDGSGFACFNDDGLGQGAVGGGRLITAPIDLTEVTGDVYLLMNSYFPNLDYQGSDERAIVHISTDMGTTWEELTELVGRGGVIGPEWMNMSDYAGQTVMLTFEYIDGDQWNFGWALASVEVSNELNIPRRDYSINAGGASTFTDAKAGEKYKVSGFISNRGLDPINSFEVVVSDGTNEITEMFSGYNIEIFGAGKYTLSEAINILNGSNDYTVSIQNVNGEAEEDEDISNNSATFNLNGIEIASNRAVVVEEATGTWCTWCPRGTVYLDEMAKRFGSNFVGIAVHNSDPMVLSEYDNAITSFNGFTGFPSVIYNRERILDPSEIVSPSLNDMQDPAPVGITVGGQYDPATGAFVSSVEIQFVEDTDADYNVSVVLTEDGMSGDAADWGQINAYSGGGQGAMGGFEDLPSPVPASLMVYDHVGRALIGGYEGVENIVVGEYANGDVDSYIFDEYNIPGDMNTENVHVIGLITDASSGEVINATSVSFDKALANGLSTSIEEFIENHFVDVYPNLVESQTTISLRLSDAKNVQANLVNQIGQVISSVDYGVQAGTTQLEYDMSTVNSGMYFLQLNIDGKIITRRITKVK